MPPEVVSEESYGKAADIWALGCVLYELCALRPAFAAFNMDSLLEKIKRGPTPLLPARYSQELRDLARSMLYRAEHRRPSAADILNAPVLAVCHLPHFHVPGHIVLTLGGVRG
jgi:NIMA (never in mitosis gene a)-related kinase 1/4/5